MFGPFVMEMKIRFTDGEQEAVATYGLPHGDVPDGAKVAEIIATTLRRLQEQMGDEWRPLTRHEYLQSLIREKTGSDEEFAFAESEEWDTSDA